MRVNRTGPSSSRTNPGRHLDRANLAGSAAPQLWLRTFLLPPLLIQLKFSPSKDEALGSGLQPVV